MAVGEAFMSAFLQVLFDRLASKHVLDFICGRDIEKVLKKLKKTLMIIKAVLDDAEDKQIKNEAVKMWLDELKDAAYDAEDVLDEFATEALRWKLESKTQSSSNQVWSLIPASLNPSMFLFNVEIESKIKEVTERLENLAKERFELGLMEVAGQSSSRVRETSSVVDESHVYGRDNDKEKIIEQLLKGGSSCGSEFLVIPIVGMGGIGKTTLAQIVYNDDRVENHFDLGAWVCVSDEFDVKRITKMILESFTSKTCNFDDLNRIQVNLKEALTGKKFLVVLDDVWNKKYSDWNVLLAPFRGGVQGSAVIVTTRSADVALMMGTVGSCCLKNLSEEECWLVFMQHAFKRRCVETNPNMVVIGKKIVEKCNGLPLAATTLGGLLRSKHDESEWEYVLNSEIWDLSEEECDILPVLRLSYYHLPSHLKQCFAFCSILPKAYEFGEREMILLWMAEGFLQQLGKKQMEELGHEYFHELLSRSFFQPSSRNKSLYVMHDLINDLAKWVAGDTCFIMEGNKQCKVSKKAHHSSYIRGRYDGIKRFEAFYEFQHLRTFLPLKLSYNGSCYLTYDVPLHLLPQLKRLRVLSLSGYCIIELPDSIGDLKHLRYLDLSHTKVRSLPESISTLCNLQTLILENCSRLKKLPANIGKLINLRHLNNSNVQSLERMPLQFGKLTSLRTLPNFVVGKGSCSGLKELGSLRHLQGTLCISSLENVVDPGDARQANVIGKQYLDVLLLKWDSTFDDSRNGGVENDVLDMLQPHRKLEELTIKGYAGAEFPTWVGDLSFSNMVLLRLENCDKCTFLPSAGQLPSLKDLYIKGMLGVRSVGAEFYGEGCAKPFPSLEILCFEDMQEWQHWFPSRADQEVDEFACLRMLSISNSPKLLGKLPDHLPSLERLEIRRCKQLVVSITSLPVLCRLEIDGCQEVVQGTADLSSLNSMVIANISNQVCLTEGFMQGLAKVEEMEVVGCKELISLWHDEVGLLQGLTSLCHLFIEGCPKLVYLASEEEVEQQQQQHQLPCRLESLELRECDSLEKLPQVLHGLTSLIKLTIEDCPRLISSPEAGFPSSLKVIEIKNCDALVFSPEVMIRNSNMAYLEHLYIELCDSLKSISIGQLPPTLKRLEIKYCNNLQSLLDEGEASSSSSSSMVTSSTSLLEYLSIEGCPCLTSLSSRDELPATLKQLKIRACTELRSVSSRGELPAALEHLFIRYCPKLKSIAERFHNNSSLEHIEIWYCENLESLPQGLHNLSHLRVLKLSICLSLVSFPEGGLPTTNLRVLYIDCCEKLEALPSHVGNLTSLQQLTIEYCPKIISFPVDGFPTNLTSLVIYNLNICKPLFQWGLDRLTSLRRLSIKGGCQNLKSFPQEEIGMMLPTSLTKLSIVDFPNVEYLSSKGFKSLTSLQYLSIYKCPKLTSFPENGLPSSLLHLYIRRCPLLKQGCKRNQGQEWFKIAHIPCVEIDDRFIYGLQEEE